jgi:acyl-CoA synthetase (AMP-forming)/AMP-acid ligase II
MTETIPAALREAVRRFGNQPALLVPHSRPVGFAELCDLASGFAKALLADGAAAGERVALWAPNHVNWIAAAVGVQRAGGVIVPLYARLAGLEVAEILERAGATRLVTTGDLAELLPAAAWERLRRIVFIDRGRQPSGGAAVWADFMAPGAVVSDEALASRESQVTGDSVSDIMFTSGTTGRPKGAVFNHRSAVAAARAMQIYNGAGPDDVFCPMGTFSHVGGYKQGWLTGIVSGAAVCWGDAFDPVSALRLIADLAITIMPAAPITWHGILHNPDRGRLDISSLRFAATGGTTIPPEIVRRLQTEMRIAQVGTGYGMTETCGLAAFTRPEDPVDKVVGTVGMPAPDTEIRIVDSRGEACPPDTPGELLIRNPRLLLEYLDDPAATSEALTGDGWFRSGDVGSFDGDGYLRITDRLKDMYIINGLNVYPAEIERCIERMPGVDDCAVVGFPDLRKGEVGAAFIVRASRSALREDEVTEFCRQALAGYKVPARIAFVDQLPRNAMGKVLKNELRRLLS